MRPQFTPRTLLLVMGLAVTGLPACRSGDAVAVPASAVEVLVMGMIHGDHRTSEGYGLDSSADAGAPNRS